MSANSAEGQELARILSKRVVENIAPEELEMFDELYEEAQAAPPGIVKAGSDDELGFGTDALVVIATPVVSAAVQAVLTFLATEVIKVSKEESSALIQKKVKAFFNSDKEEEPPPLTQEQLLMVKKLTVKRAREMGMKEEKANQLALALIGSLALK